MNNKDFIYAMNRLENFCPFMMAAILGKIPILSLHYNGVGKKWQLQSHSNFVTNVKYPSLIVRWFYEVPVVSICLVFCDLKELINGLFLSVYNQQFVQRKLKPDGILLLKLGNVLQIKHISSESENPK